MVMLICDEERKTNSKKTRKNWFIFVRDSLVCDLSREKIAKKPFSQTRKKADKYFGFLSHSSSSSVTLSEQTPF